MIYVVRLDFLTAKISPRGGVKESRILYSQDTGVIAKHSVWKHVLAARSISAPTNQHQTKMTWTLSLPLQYKGEQSDHVELFGRMLQLYSG